MLNPEDLLDEAEAAKRMRRSKYWLRELRLRGEGPKYIPLGNRPYYDPADLADWLENRKLDPTKVDEASS